MLKWCFTTRQNQCFSASRPRPTGGPQSSFWWAGRHFSFCLKLQLHTQVSWNLWKVNIISYKSVQKPANKFIQTQSEVWKRPKKLKSVWWAATIFKLSLVDREQGSPAWEESYWLIFSSLYLCNWLKRWPKRNRPFLWLYFDIELEVKLWL